MALARQVTRDRPPAAERGAGVLPCADGTAPRRRAPPLSPAAADPDCARPQRRCLATGRVGDPRGMIRFVIDPDDRVVIDVDRRLPGRGLWVTATRDAVTRAIKRRAFARAARRAVAVDPDLVERVAALLTRRCLDGLGLARRAGQAVAGFEAVRDALVSGRVGRSGPPVAVLLAARDGAADGRRRLAALAGGTVPVIALFDGAALGAALGRGAVVHAAIADGRLAARLIDDAARLAGLVAPPEAPAPDGSPNILRTKSDGDDGE